MRFPWWTVLENGCSGAVKANISETCALFAGFSASRGFGGLNLSLELPRRLGIFAPFPIFNLQSITMGILFISILTLVLILISFFVIMIVLMQRTSQSGGMGAALGGGAAESAFGSETNNILTKGTIYGIIAFFVVALGLYLMYQGQLSERDTAIDPALLAVEAEDAGTDATAADLQADLEGTIDVATESIAEGADAVAGTITEVEAQEGAEVPVSVPVETAQSVPPAN